MGELNHVPSCLLQRELCPRGQAQPLEATLVKVRASVRGAARSRKGQSCAGARAEPNVVDAAMKAWVRTVVGFRLEGLTLQKGKQDEYCKWEHCCRQ